MFVFVEWYCCIAFHDPRLKSLFSLFETGKQLYYSSSLTGPWMRVSWWEGGWAPTSSSTWPCTNNNYASFYMCSLSLPNTSLPPIYIIHMFQDCWVRVAARDFRPLWCAATSDLNTQPPRAQMCLSH